MDRWNGLLFASVSVFPSHIYHTPPVFLWRGIKSTDTGVENHKEEKVGDRGRGGGNWTRVDEGR